jgi:hypothetical protein
MCSVLGFYEPEYRVGMRIANTYENIATINYRNMRCYAKLGA